MTDEKLFQWLRGSLVNLSSEISEFHFRIPEQGSPEALNTPSFLKARDEFVASYERFLVAFNEAQGDQAEKVPSYADTYTGLSEIPWERPSLRLLD